MAAYSMCVQVCMYRSVQVCVQICVYMYGRVCVCVCLCVYVGYVWVYVHVSV